MHESMDQLVRSRKTGNMKLNCRINEEAIPLHLTFSNSN